MKRFMLRMTPLERMNHTTTTIRHFLLVAFIAAPLVLTGCGGDDGSSPPASDEPDMSVDAAEMGMNRAPEARVGDDRSVAVGAQVELDASSSADPDGDELAFAWTIASAPGGSSADIDDPNASTTFFTPDVAGVYEFSIEVSDSELADSDQVVIAALDQPVADAGTDQTGEVGQTITFDGSASSAPGGAQLDFEWSFVARPDMSDAVFDDPSIEVATFTPDQPGTYIVELEVDNGIETSIDRATAEVAPEGGRLTSTVYVAPDGDDSNSGTEAAPLQTFDAALQLFRDEGMVDRIDLAEGVYTLENAPYEVSKALDINGPDNESAEAVLSGDGDLFDLKSDAFVTFLNVSLQTPDKAVDTPEGTTVSFIDVVCEADLCVRAGALFSNDGGRVEVRRSEFIGDENSSRQGIVASFPEDISIVDSTIRDFGTYGVQVLNGPLTVRDSEFKDTPTAINLISDQPEASTLIENTTFDSNEMALENLGGPNVTIRNSTVSNSTGVAILTQGGALVLRNSTVQNSSSHGIDVDDDAIVTLRDSEISLCGDDAVRVRGSSSRLDMGTDTSTGNNVISDNQGNALLDTRPSEASGFIRMSSTQLDATTPPPGTYSGPGFDQYNMRIVNDTEVQVF